MSEKKVKAEHGVVCYQPHEKYGYFAWPTVARMDDGTLVVGASGCRFDHACPYGKTVLFRSTDDGATWTPPRVLNDTPLDDRDCGIVSLGGSKLLVTWFSSDISVHFEYAREAYELSDAEAARWQAVFDTYTPEVLEKWIGSWIRISVDGGEAWGDFIRVPVNSPCGPIRLASGDLMYLGKQWVMPGQERVGCILAARSGDDGHTWTSLGSVPPADGTDHQDYHEPHVAELPSGKLIGLIRYENRSEHADYVHFSLFQTESDDGGRTWTQAKYLDVYGSPPHLIRHSSGALVCVYSYRKAPHGQRIMISWDQGATWDSGIILRDDAPPRDLGYPASVEMPDGTILTVYYQQHDGQYKNAGILWSRWELPEKP